MTRAVFGFGTGRSGSLSLATLLNGQPRCAVLHELKPIGGGTRVVEAFPPWERDASLLTSAIDAVRDLDGSIVGDVGAYWLRYVEAIIDLADLDAHFVCLRRPRDAVVDSYVRKLTRPTGTKNHWVNHDGTQWVADPVFDPIHPKFEVDDLATAIGMYWDEYYAEAERLAAAFPERVRIWSTDEVLNTAQGQRAVLDYAGVPRSEQQLKVGTHRNRSTRSVHGYARIAWVRVAHRGRGANA